MESRVALGLVKRHAETYHVLAERHRGAHAVLVDAIRYAHSEGWTVSELAEASGLSRPAVYRAVRRTRRQ